MDDRAGLSIDETTMRRCFDIAAESARHGGYPYAAIVTRKGRIVVESTNRVSQDGDVTRHAEVVAIAMAQKALACTSLDDCTLYANIEPCALCAYAIRETRFSRVVFGLSSPFMGGFSRWNILGDETISAKMPEIFAPPPIVAANFLAEEADANLRRASPIFWAFARSRGLLEQGSPPDGLEPLPLKAQSARVRMKQMTMRVLRRRVFDRFGRGGG
jgi:tRNA(adenine34) deaminase